MLLVSRVDWECCGDVLVRDVLQLRGLSVCGCFGLSDVQWGVYSVQCWVLQRRGLQSMRGVWGGEVSVGVGWELIGGVYWMLQRDVHQAHAEWDELMSAVQFEFGHESSGECSDVRCPPVTVQVGV